jgi:hypothetical protein
MNTIEKLKSVTDLVTNVLKNYPETRSDDTKLYLQCAKELGATKLSDLEEINLNIVSVHKTRQKIQNQDKMYLPDVDTIKIRKKRKIEYRQFMIQPSV